MTLFAHLLVERFGWVLIHSLWQFLVIALVVRLLGRVFAGRNGASANYIIGLSGLAVMTAAPVVTWFFIPATPPASAGPAAPDSVVERMEAQRLTPAERPFPAMAGQVSPSREVIEQSPSEYSLAEALSAGWTTLAERLRPWLPILVMCWLVGMSFCSLRPFVGWLTLYRLRTSGVSTAGRVLEESARQIAARLRMRQTVSVLRSTLAKTPLVVGYLRPVLLVPVGMVTQLPLAELEAILAHELAHIRRHDFVVNLWQTSLETVFFYHPAVWSLSHRLRDQREHCCDDVALAVIGDPVCYGRALLHVEELRGPEPLLALGAGGGSLAGRIQRLFGQPTRPSSAAGLVAGVLLPSLTLASVLAAFAWAAPDGKAEQAKEKPQQKSDPVPVAKPIPAPAPAARSLDIVIAEQAIVWDGRIRTWDEVVAELRAIRIAQGKPIHANFYFTNAAHSAGLSDIYNAKVFEIYKELFEPAGVSFGSISPRAGPRYDVLRKAEDLVPDPKSLRSGVVVEKGRPKAGVLVVLIPEEGQMPVMLKPDLTLRVPLDEVWTITGQGGRFTLPVQPAHAVDKLAEPPTYALAAISPTAYRLAEVPAEGAEAKIELLPLARVELTPVEGKLQRINLSLRGGLPDTSPGFSVGEIELRDKPLPLDLPPGKITILRAFPQEDGGQRLYPAATVRIGPGDNQKISLPNVTEAEAERQWIEESLRPKGGAKKPDGTFQMTGTVTLAVTGEPIAGAKITVIVAGQNPDGTLRTREGTTDAQGRYTVEVPAGNSRAHWLHCPPGYWREIAGIEDFVTSTEKPVFRKDYVVRRGPVWRVRVASASAETPPSGFQISTIKENAYALAELDASGHGQITIPGSPGECQLNAFERNQQFEPIQPVTLKYEAGFRSDEVIEHVVDPQGPAHRLTDKQGKTATLSGALVTVEKGVATIDFDARPQDPKKLGKVIGVIVDDAGAPVEGAAVGIAMGTRNGGSAMTFLRATSDAAGRFAVERVPIAKSQPDNTVLSVIVTKEGYGGLDARGGLGSPGFDLPIDAQTPRDVGQIRLGKGHSIRLRVVGPQDEPLVGALVTPSGGYAARQQAVTTDEKGECEIRNLKKGLQQFDARYGNLLAQTKLMVGGPSAQATLYLKPLNPPAQPVAATKQWEPVQPGDSAPEWKVAAWSDDRSRKLADFRGKVVVLDFWGTWCGPCLQAVPMMKELEKKYKGQGVVFLSIHTAGTQMKQVQELMRQLEWDVPAGLDEGEDAAGGTTVQRYGVEAFPNVVVVDRGGKVHFNTGAIGPEAGMKKLKEAAAALSIPFPLNEQTPAEEALEIQSRIFGRLYGDAIDAALAAR